MHGECWLFYKLRGELPAVGLTVDGGQGIIGEAIYCPSAPEEARCIVASARRHSACPPQYDESRKRGNNAIIGTVKLAQPGSTGELRAALAAGEMDDLETWLRTQRRTEELAALTMGGGQHHAQQWFEREGDSLTASAAAQDILSRWQAPRRLLGGTACSSEAFSVQRIPTYPGR